MSDTGLSMWIRVPAHHVNTYKQELPYNDGFHPGPGRFTLPTVSCTLNQRGKCQASVVVLHEHAGARWPMLVYNKTDFDGRWSGRLFPSEQFRQQPTDYLVFVRAEPE